MKTANNSFQANPRTHERQWYVVDASDQVLGRLATKIATVLMGKHKPTYTPHVDTGDFVVVLNADKIKITGRKKETMAHESYSRYPSGRKVTPIKAVLERHPERVLRESVRRMLPKNALARHMLAKLKLYKGTEHPHQAQMPDPFPL